jgi:uncharacterized Zn finger protein (UPF0148 family)
VETEPNYQNDYKGDIVCPTCGILVSLKSFEQHLCQAQDILNHMAAKGAKNIEEEINAFLATDEGRYLQWEAEERRLRGI